jgi:RNase P/RNase MRP subunit POP5
MRKRTPASPFTIPFMLADLGMTSLETIMRRSLMMVQGTCSAAEYQRMVLEKVLAMQRATLVAARGQSHAAMLSPFVTRSRANAKRLRRER